MRKDFGGIIISPSCSNQCVFCGLGVKVSKEEMKKQIRKACLNLEEFKHKGIEKIEISGADPIEYEEITSLIRYIKKMGFKFVQLSTHGKDLADKSLAYKLALSKVDRLRIPIHGSSPEIHDFVSGRKGSLIKVIKGIGNIKRVSPKIQIQISVLILQQNKNDLINLIKLFKAMKINDCYFTIPAISNGDYSYYIPLKDISRYVNKIEAQFEKNGIKGKFMEIPFCVFGKIKKNIINDSLPPDLGKNCQPPKIFQTKTKDLPSYRIKKKIAMCEKCKADSICDGFFANDIDKFGTGELKQIV